MAILDSVKNIVSAEVDRRVTNSISSGFKKVAGNLMGIDITPSRSSNPALRPSKGRYTTENLDYPIGVEKDPQQGHYIIFEIMEQDTGKLEAIAAERTKARQRQIDDTNKLDAINMGAGFAPLTAADKKQKQVIEDHQKATKNYRGNYFINQIKATTTRMPWCIALYMPPSVSVSYGANYNEKDIGILAESGANVIQAFMDNSKSGGTAAGVGAATRAIGAGVKDAINKGSMSALDAIAPGAAALIAMERGKIITPRMEMMFSGIGRRSFSYEFTFVPKSKQESNRVKKIIETFKIHMHSDFVGGNVREMKIPDYFNIKYMYKGNENEYLNRISTCVLTKMDVNYGGDRYVSYEDGAPQTTKISLDFTEMEIITRDKIEAGF
jgi:hypothetical protein